MASRPTTTTFLGMFTLVENYAKKNRSYFPIVVLLPPNPAIATRLLRFATKKLKNPGRVIHRWIGFSNTFSVVYHKPPNS